MPPAIVTRHLGKIFANSPLAVTVIAGAQSTRGFFDDDAILMDDGTGADVKRDNRVVSVKTGSLTGVVQDTAMTIDGSSYKVRSVLPQDDGQVTRYVVARVTP